MPTEKLIRGHRQFRRKFAEEQEVFRRLAERGQDPKVLWIGCSDSRVIPEQITGADPGELFMLRNVANIVPPSHRASEAVGAVIEYAVLHLHIPHVVICGHTDCGGIKALVSGHLDRLREPHLARWLDLARPACTRVEASTSSAEARYQETIKANILLQRQHLLTYGCVAKAVQAGSLAVHAWLYDLQTSDLLAYDEASVAWTPVQS